MIAVIDEASSDAIASDTGKLRAGSGDALGGFATARRRIEIGAFAKIPAEVLASVLTDVHFLDAILPEVDNGKQIAIRIELDETRVEE